MTVTNVTPPTISGSTVQGSALHATAGTWTYDDDLISYAYQWERCDAVGANCVDIAGATSSGYILVAADVGHTLRVRVTATEYPAPTPPAGTLRAFFTDFYTQWGYSSNDHNGQIFQNRWNTSNLQTLLSAQTPWPSTGGAAISEITDHLARPGFRFVCNPEMTDGSGSKKVEIYESNGDGGHVNPYGQAMIRGRGYTDEISFVVRFPSTGNPSGFPGPDEGVYDRRNVFWQHSMDPSELNYFGISRLGYTNRFFLSIGRHIGANSEEHADTLSWEVEMDKDYLFRYVIKWASDATGTFQWWVQRETDPVEVQYTNYTGQTWWAIPNTEFGFYSAPSLDNEVIISDIRVTAH